MSVRSNTIQSLRAEVCFMGKKKLTLVKSDKKLEKKNAFKRRFLTVIKKAIELNLITKTKLFVVLSNDNVLHQYCSEPTEKF